jgi:ketosteroid isomerase-like protein
MMRGRLALSLFQVLLGLCAVAVTQGQERPSPDEAGVRALDDQERAAILNQDISALERLWSDRLVVNTPLNRVNGKLDALDLVRRGQIHYSAFERRVEFIRVDGDLAIIMGAETVRPIGKAPFAGQTVQRRFTHIWRKEAGTWRLIARHANIIPPPR